MITKQIRKLNALFYILLEMVSRSGLFILPALLQKLVGELFFFDVWGGKFGGNFSERFLGSKTSGNISEHFS